MFQASEPSIDVLNTRRRNSGRVTFDMPPTDIETVNDRSEVAIEPLTRWNSVRSARHGPFSGSQETNMSSVLDTLRGSTLQEDAKDESGNAQLDTERLLNRLDRRLLGPLFLMALMHGFDKIVSHARTMGMDIDANINDDQWSALLMTFFVGFILSTVLIVSFVRSAGQRILSCMAFVTVLTGFVTATNAVVNKTNNAYIWVIVTRAIQGVCEGAFTALMATYLLQFYTAGQLASRMLLFFCVPTMSSAIGSLWAFGIFHVSNGPLYNWQYYFIGEGALTVLIGLACFLILPAGPQEFCYLRSHEEEIASLTAESEKQSNFRPERTSIREYMLLASNRNAVYWMLIDLSLSVPMTILPLYLPQIIYRAHFTAQLSNLLTCFPYLVAVGFLFLVIGRSSTGNRLTWIIAIFIMQAVGFIVYLYTATHKGMSSRVIAYLSTFLMACGVGTTNILAAKYFGPLIPNNEQRLFLNTLGVCLINSGGMLMSWLFRMTNNRAEICAICFASFGVFITLLSALASRSSVNKCSPSVGV